MFDDIIKERNMLFLLNNNVVDSKPVKQLFSNYIFLGKQKKRWF